MPIVSAIDKLYGRAATERRLSGFAANAKRYDDNEGIVPAVESGQVEPASSTTTSPSGDELVEGFEEARRRARELADVS